MDLDNNEKPIDLKKHRQHHFISPKFIIRFILIIGAMIFLFYKFFGAVENKQSDQSQPEIIDSNSISIEVDTSK